MIAKSRSARAPAAGRSGRAGRRRGLPSLLPAHASSHREAPCITTRPKVDGTDFYMFRSYEGVDANGAAAAATT